MSGMVSAIIVAAGKGVRMGPNTDKLFLEVAGRPVVAHTWQRPIQGLLQESERMLHIEAPHVGAPSAIQVGDGVAIL